MARALLLIALECYVVVFSFQVGQESFELEEMLSVICAQGDSDTMPVVDAKAVQKKLTEATNFRSVAIGGCFLTGSCALQPVEKLPYQPVVALLTSGRRVSGLSVGHVDNTSIAGLGEHVVFTDGASELERIGLLVSLEATRLCSLYPELHCRKGSSPL